MPDTTTITRYRARYILEHLTFREGAALDVADGRVVALHPAADTLPGDADVDEIDLGDVALMPGLVNAHSHAFQRAMRGHSEHLAPERPDDDFWTWREAMYELALRLDPDEFQAVATLCFREMAATGITTVGEFHYVHHAPDGTPYDDPGELAHRVIAAARAAGLRICLLRVAYARAGFERPADPRQRRFVEPDVTTYLERFDALRRRYEGDPLVSFGLAPHSVRAVPRDWLEAIAAYAARHDLPVHIHACEQRAELEQCDVEYGMTPIELLDAVGLLGPRTTLVHATHLGAHDHELLARTQPTVCACPTTERNLGDGFLPARQLVADDVPICLGSDSHTVIDLWEEMRLVEYHERLRYERRNVLASPRTPHTAHVLWPMGTTHGARSLSLPVGRLEPGHHADFLTLDLEHIALAGATRETLLAVATMSMPPGAVQEVFVGGRRAV